MAKGLGAAPGCLGAAVSFGLHDQAGLKPAAPQVRRQSLQIYAGVILERISLDRAGQMTGRADSSRHMSVCPTDVLAEHSGERLVSLRYGHCALYARAIARVPGGMATCLHCTLHLGSTWN
jgi:hypothetical protein